MKTIFRNFLLTLQRFKLASVLNVLGLGIAFAAFMVIMMQVRYDAGFDKFHSKTGRIFRVEPSGDSTEYGTNVSYPVLEYIRSYPAVEHISVYSEWGKEESYVSVETRGEKSGFMEKIAEINPDFTEIFDFKFTEGSASDFNSPGAAIIPETMARKFFGDESAIGRTIDFTMGNMTFRVAAVYADFPENTFLKPSIYVFNNPEAKPEGSQEWNWSSYQVILTLNSAVEKQELETIWFQNLIAAADASGSKWYVKALRLNPIEQIYTSKDMYAFDDFPKSDPTNTAILFSIAILVIAIAGINYVNFATSLVPMRLRSINTRKVLGSSTREIRTGLIVESLGIALLAFGVSLFIVYFLSATPVAGLIESDMGLRSNMPVVWLSLGIASVVGIVSGVYPAFYSTSFQPALVLKGSFGLSPSGKKLRTAMIGFQFVVSIGLIIAAMFMQLQNRYMRGMETGVEKDRIAMMKLNSGEFFQRKEVLIEKLKEDPSIVDAGTGVQVGGADVYSIWGFGRGNEETVKLDMLNVSWNLPEMLELELLDGSLFTETDKLNKTPKLLINQSAQRRYNLNVGDKLEQDENWEIAGILKDVNYKSLRNGIEPMAFGYSPNGWEGNWLYIKFSGDPDRAIKHIRESVATIDPVYPVEIQFYDKVFEKLYAKERKMTSLITLFSLLAIAISLIGVFGLVVFETQFRRKEIGVRKVFGSTVAEILTLLNRNFIKIVIICFVLAAPIAYMGVIEWLGNFAYRTPVYWWVFLLALLVVGTITVVTVSIQSWRAATANQVEALRNE